MISDRNAILVRCYFYERDLITESIGCPAAGFMVGDELEVLYDGFLVQPGEGVEPEYDTVDAG